MKLLTFAVPCYNSAAYMEKGQVATSNADLELQKLQTDWKGNTRLSSGRSISQMVDMDRQSIPGSPMQEESILR